MTRGTWSRQAGMPWPHGGPWAISELCPAPNHNSMNAARGREPQYRAGKGNLVGEARAKFPACICPRAVWLRNEDNRLRRGRSRRASSKPAVTKGRAGAWVPRGVRAPDLSAGLCRTPEGRRTHDRAINGGGVINAQKLCGNCTVKDECREYVLAADPTGAWPGVFGGLSQRERKAMT